MPTIRERANGTFELRVTHRALPKPYYSTHGARGEAEDYGRRLVAALDRGDVPPELASAPEGRATPLAAMLKEYQRLAAISSTDKPMVESLRTTLDVDVEGITVRWVDDWVKTLKGQRLAPGTIRKKIESLARAVDWWQRRVYEGREAPSNPLRTLPRGYSSYGQDDVEVGEEAPYDESRDRRLHPGEPEKIEAAIGQDPEFLLLWRLIVHTGLRLREAYRLRGRDVRFELRTIHIPKSKTGKARDVPMTREVHDWLAAARVGADDLVFGFWNGDDEDLARCSNRLSKRFTAAFARAGVDDLTEHDLRHEATCRWMLLKKRGQWVFRSEEVQRITGHKNVQQFQRYLSLRGSDLAVRLW